MRRRPLTFGEALDSWRIDGEIRGGHRPSETLAFVSALEDIADGQAARRRVQPEGFALADDVEPRAITFLRRIFGR
jgi:hypothetical protein